MVQGKRADLMHLVAGGSGFLGKFLVHRLVKEGKSVRVFDKEETEPRNEVEYILGNIANQEDLDNAMEGCDVVYNLISLLPCSRAGNQFEKVNVLGTKNVLEAAKKNKVKKVIHISSSIVYGNPTEIPLTEGSATEPIGTYGKSKLRAEKVCLDYVDKGLDITILRPRFIVGPGRLGLLTILFDWVQKGKNIYSIGNGRNRFQMVGVNDLVEACVLAERKAGSAIYNIGASNVPTVKEMLEDLTKHAGTNSKVIALHPIAAKAPLYLLDKLGLSPLGTEHYLIADKDYVLDTKKAESELGWKPKESQTEMLIKAYDYYIKHKADISGKSGADFPKEKILRAIKFFS